MSSDLIFASLSRQGQAAIKKDEYKIGEISKDRKLKGLHEDDSHPQAADYKVQAKTDPNDLTDDQGTDESDDQEHLDLFA